MKVIVFGSKGMLGSELCAQLKDQQLYAFDNQDLDITDQQKVSAKIEELKPDLIFNAAAYNNVDKAEDPAENQKVFKLNSDAVGYIAEAAERVGATLIQYSTGFVFDGNNPEGYREDDQPNPQSVYAKSKASSEEQAKKCSKHYIVRLNLLFGRGGSGPNAKKSFPDLILDLAKTKSEFDFVANEISTPTYAPDLAKASIALTSASDRQKHPYGIYHLPNSGRASWYDFAAEVFRIKQVNAKINAVAADKFVRPAKRPLCSVLLNTKFPEQRSWQQALEEYLKI